MDPLRVHRQVRDELGKASTAEEYDATLASILDHASDANQRNSGLDEKQSAMRLRWADDAAKTAKRPPTPEELEEFMRPGWTQASPRRPDASVTRRRSSAWPVASRAGGGGRSALPAGRRHRVHRQPCRRLDGEIPRPRPPQGVTSCRHNECIEIRRSDLDRSIGPKSIRQALANNGMAVKALQDSLGKMETSLGVIPRLFVRVTKTDAWRHWIDADGEFKAATRPTSGPSSKAPSRFRLPYARRYH